MYEKSSTPRSPEPGEKLIKTIKKTIKNYYNLPYNDHFSLKQLMYYGTNKYI